VQRQLHSEVSVGMPVVRLLSRPHVEIALAYLASYVLLDWLSYVHPYAAFGITPWNPPTGLSFALILLFGVEFLPWLFIAPVLADGIVRGFALPLPAEIAAGAIIGGGYAAATALLLTPRLRFDAALATRGSLVMLLTAAIVSTAVVAGLYVLMLVGIGLLPAAESASAALRFWVGDMIGVAVLTPFLLVLMTRRRPLHLSSEALVLAAVVAAAMFAVFGFAGAFRFQLFYLFFLPVIWTAVRFGLEGVTVGLLLTQVGLIAAIHFTEDAATDVTSYQALMVVLTLTGLAVGMLVSEQQRTQQQLRINQEALNRAFRLASMGEFAATLAHEINQPLTAVANYARVARNAPSIAAASEAADRVIAQVDRAAEVVRRLRNFIRLGHGETGPAQVRDLVEAAISYCRAELDRQGVEVQVRIARDLLEVSVDAVQIEQVLVNLLRNSAEALSEAGRHDGRIVVTGTREGEAVAIEVRDNGPGFDPGVAERATSPFTTTKPEGLGLGLSLARSMVEAHGSALAIESGAFGASVSFTLPRATAGKDNT
jgi:two-component system, LuxR family, sensor kinase FixL